MNESGGPGHCILDGYIHNVVDCITVQRGQYHFKVVYVWGGELFTILRRRRYFNEATSKFYAGCVVEAFDYTASTNTPPWNTPPHIKENFRETEKNSHT